MHLTLRVAWHENRWNGTVCMSPSQNAFCLMLDRIREERDDVAEETIKGRHWADLIPEQHPACKAEAGAFMSSRPWYRLFQHPYQKIPTATATHGHLRPYRFLVPEYATFAVPFWWMLKENQKDIDQMFPDPLPPDEDAPFHTAWVFSRERQEHLSQHFFRKVKDNESMVFFYCKEGQPLGEEINRLVIGVGLIQKVGNLMWFETNDSSKRSYPLWDRLIRHSIRFDGHEGFLLPYHDYLKPTGDPEEDLRRQGDLPPEFWSNLLVSDWPGKEDILGKDR